MKASERARERWTRPAQPALTPADVQGTCRWCGARVLWLRNTTTGKVAPIDAAPVPGGNVSVDLADCRYQVHGPLEQLQLDPTADAPDARPTLHLNHYATCSNLTRRRLAREGRRRPPGDAS